VILDAPVIHLGPKPDKVVPDLAGWRRERMPDAIGPDDGPAHYDVTPDWVCEVLSERTERVDRAKKMRIYRRERVGHVWLLSPALQTREVYRIEDGRWVLLDTFEGRRRCAGRAVRGDRASARRPLGAVVDDHESGARRKKTRRQANGGMGARSLIAKSPKVARCSRSGCQPPGRPSWRSRQATRRLGRRLLGQERTP
jgi:hypothetical protein